MDSREDQPLVTFPDGDGPDNDLQIDLSPAIPSSVAGELTTAGGTVDTVKFEQKSMTSASKTKVVTDGYSTEQASTNSAEMKRLQAGDMDYQESKAASAMRNRVEVDGISAEQNAAMLKVSKPKAPESSLANALFKDFSLVIW